MCFTRIKNWKSFFIRKKSDWDREKKIRPFFRRGIFMPRSQSHSHSWTKRISPDLNIFPGSIWKDFSSSIYIYTKKKQEGAKKRRYGRLRRDIYLYTHQCENFFYLSKHFNAVAQKKKKPKALQLLRFSFFLESSFCTLPSSEVSSSSIESSGVEYVKLPRRSVGMNLMRFSRKIGFLQIETDLQKTEVKMVWFSCDWKKLNYWWELSPFGGGSVEERECRFVI